MDLCVTGSPEAVKLENSNFGNWKMGNLDTIKQQWRTLVASSLLLCTVDSVLLWALIFKKRVTLVAHIR